MNGGRFPPTKAAMKEVGGSYYTIKKIVEELQYNAKRPVDKDIVVKEASARKAAIRKVNLMSKVEETLSSSTTTEHGECEDVDGGINKETRSLTKSGVESEDTNSSREAEAKLQTPLAAEQSQQTLLQEMSRISVTDHKEAAAQVLESELESFSRSEEPEKNIKQKDSRMGGFKFDGSKLMDEQKRSPELEKSTRELSNEQKVDTQAESKPSIWKNLKSFADGILNMWWK